MAETAHQGAAYDSDRQKLGDVYARALLAAATSSDSVEEVMEQTESLCQDLLASTPRIRQLLESPRINHQDKERMLDKAFAGRMDTTLLNFLKVLSRHGRMDCLSAIERSLKDQYNTLQGRIEVQVTSATPLDEETRAAITSQLVSSLNSQVELVVEVNPELIGGTIIRIGDTVYDGSVANRLARIKQDALARTTMEFQQAADRFASGEPG
jgi:F-type H+-transporting ATPase subunit delta